MDPEGTGADASASRPVVPSGPGVLRWLVTHLWVVVAHGLAIAALGLTSYGVSTAVEAWMPTSAFEITHDEAPSELPGWVFALLGGFAVATWMGQAILGKAFRALVMWLLAWTIGYGLWCLSFWPPPATWPGDAAPAAQRREWAERTFGAWYEASAKALARHPDVVRRCGTPLQVVPVAGQHKARYHLPDADLPGLQKCSGAFAIQAEGPRGTAHATIAFSDWLRTSETTPRRLAPEAPTVPLPEDPARTTARRSLGIQGQVYIPGKAPEDFTDRVAVE